MNTSEKTFNSEYRGISVQIIINKFCIFCYAQDMNTE